MPTFRLRLISFLRWTEKYTKTDMVYLAGVALWTNLNVIITSAFALLLSIAFANLLPRETYGTYQYLISLSALLTAACLSGMSGAVAQSVARGFEGDVRRGVRAQLNWNIVPMSIGCIGAIYYLFHGNVEIGLGLGAVALFTPLVNTFNTYSGYLFGKQEFKRTFIYSNIVNGFYYASIFAAVLLAKDAAFLVFINLGVNALATAFVYFRTLLYVTPNDRTDPETISYGKHLSVMGAFSIAVNQLDSVLVFHFLGPIQLAVYSFATMLPERIGALLGFVGTAAFPKFANRTLAELRDTIISKTVRTALLGAAVSLLYALCAPFLFRLLFPKYLDVIPYTELYAVVIMLLGANLVSIALQAKRLKAELYIVSFVNPALLIGLQIPLLLLYGIWGMLWARIISDVIGISIGIVLLFRASRREKRENARAL